jgi:branched-chain amino acid transport system substrate-binding protein
MKGLGPIKATLILAYNYDALPLVMAAADKAGSTDAKAIATALERSDTQQAAKTAILARYNYTVSSHAPSVGKGEFIFIAPSERRDGQYH